MNARTEPNPFFLDDTVKLARHRFLNRIITRLIGQVSGLNALGNIYQSDTRLSGISNPDDFIEQALQILGIQYRINNNASANIPREGGLVVVSNHPFGGIDGLILYDLLRRQRKDVKILANGILKKVPSLSELFFDVDPINPKRSTAKNASSLKQAIKWLRKGGCLIVFPSGEVSHLNLKEHRVCDPQWNPSIARVIKLGKATALPVYFKGSNSLNFQLLGLIHPRLRTLMLPREMLNKVNSDIQLQVGKSINYSRMKQIDDKKLICFLRLSTYALQTSDAESKQPNPQSLTHMVSITNPVPKALLNNELDYLPDSQTLHETGKVRVVYANASQIPWLLQEIGRLRECSFREVGEGTGKDTDLDVYDQHYTHLFLWDKKQQRIMGAYRLGLVDKIIEQHGIQGLYSYSLFKFGKKELYAMGPAIELGRSFICADYQRSPAALSLLWKGIGLFIVKQAHYTTLFGPVSISNDYRESAKKFIVDCLKTSCLMRELSHRIKPRNPYKMASRSTWKRKELASLEDINLVSEVVSQIEQGERGIPILIKQYIKLGGRFLEFNVDHNFNNALDGLIVVDLRDTERQLLEYFMGKDNARSYLDRVSCKYNKAS